MKLIHLSDLHIGKRVNEFPMIQDQEYILKSILEIIDSEAPDGVIIAGDVYDKSVPSAEAVTLLDNFLVSLAKRSLEVYIIAGNHDSPERLSFGNRLIEASGIHISPIYSGNVEPYSLCGANIYLLPFIKPAHVRACYPDEEISSYSDAIKVAVGKMNIDPSKVNVLVTHQFVTGASQCDSEEISVGGSDNVEASVFEPFNYVALGHIHSPQNISPKIRYCGTPLKYSFSEASHKKSVTVVEISDNSNLSVRTVPLTPIHDMVEIKGTFADLTNKTYYEGTSLTDDYLHITLTDENDIPDAISKLRMIYKNIMRLDYDNKRTRHKVNISGATDVDNKSPLDLFSDFYREQNGFEMTEQQSEYVSCLIEKIWEEEL